MRRFARIPMLVMLLTLMPGTSARAEGLVSGQSYKPVSPAQSIEVLAIDDSSDNLILKQEFERHLQEAGYVLAPGAPLVLTFGSHGALGTWNSDKRYLVEMHARGGEEGGEDAGVRFNLFDSNRGGLLNAGNADRSTSDTRYRLDAVVTDRQSGRRLWHGWASANLRRSDGAVLTLSMVRPLVGAIGKTVRKQTFPTPQ